MAPRSPVCDEVLEQIALRERANESLKGYSNGMKQRLLIGRALIHGPKLLFLDEPTRGLDPAMARGIRQMVVDLAQQGITVFLTTHYMEEADQLCHRVGILDHGRIVALDSPARLKAAHGGDSLEEVFIRRRRSITGGCRQPSQRHGRISFSGQCVS